MKIAREARGWTLEQLSDRSGVDIGTINALENRDSKRSSYAPKLAAGLGISLEQLFSETPPAVAGLAQPMSHQEFTLPPSINREQLMNVNFTLPPLFLMTMPDEALQDTTPKGVGLIMQTVPPSHRPPPGRVILARDTSGAIYVRRFGEGTGPGWRAMATNTAYRELDSEAAGLTLLAVLRWVDGEDH